MDGFEKVKVATRLPKLAMDIKKVPDYFKNQFSQLKDEIDQLLEIEQECRDLSVFAANGKKCAQAKRYAPFECYVQIHGH